MPIDANILVIGYGSELRGDDAIGRLAAREVAEWRTPGVHVIEAHQLTPELAAALAEVRVALFVDASARPGAPLRCTPLAPRRTSSSGHSSDPPALLGLALALYGHAPEAYQIAIPVARYTLGAAPSPQAIHGMRRALELIQSILDDAASR